MSTITSGFLSTTINGLSINKSYPCNSNNYNNKASRDVTYVVMHYTGNAKDTALNNCKYFQGSGRSASSHFFVDDSSIYQSVELRDIAWHCGCSAGYKNACRNTNSFGIEMCTSGNYLVSEKTQINAAYLCAYLCKMIGITSSKVDTYVVRHYDVVKTNKKCPAQFVNDNSQWVRFKKWVKNILNTGSHESSNNSSVTTTSANNSTPSIQTNNLKVKVIVSSLNIRSGAGTKYNVVGSIKDKGTYTITKTSGNWGYLKSGTGWINISSNYVKRV